MWGILLNYICNLIKIIGDEFYGLNGMICVYVFKNLFVVDMGLVCMSLFDFYLRVI